MIGKFLVSFVDFKHSFILLLFNFYHHFSHPRLHVFLVVLVVCAKYHWYKENNQTWISLFYNCHTLISFGDCHLLRFLFLLAKLSCLTPVSAQYERFFYVLEKNMKIPKKGGQNGHLETFSGPWLAWATRKLRVEVTSLLGWVVVQPPPLISYK